MRRPLLLTLAGPVLAAAFGASAQELDRYGGDADYAPTPAPQVQRTAYTPATPGLMGAPLPAGPTRFLSWSGKSAAPAQPEPPQPIARHAPPPQPVARYVPPPQLRPAPPPAPRRVEPAPTESRPVLEADRTPSRPWTEWRRPDAAPPAAAVPDGWTAFDPAALARREKGRAPARRAPSQASSQSVAASAPEAPTPAVRRTIYDPAPPVRSRAPAPTAAAPLPAPTQAAYDNRGVRHYSLHREFGMRPDPTPIPPQFFTATADLSGGEPAGPDPVVGTGKAAGATRARVAAQSSDPS